MCLIVSGFRYWLIVFPVSIIIIVTILLYKHWGVVLDIVRLVIIPVNSVPMEPWLRIVVLVRVFILGLFRMLARPVLVILDTLILVSLCAIPVNTT